MDNIEKENNTEWKKELRSEILTAFTGNKTERALAFDKISAYYNNHTIPLYKYFKNTEQNLDNLKTNKIWFSAACNFNDVFDCDISIDRHSLTLSLLEQVNNKDIYNIIDKLVHEKISEMHSSFKDSINRIGISCFSESYKSLLMWAHYANNDCGMCVEYDMYKIFKKYDIRLIPIQYSDIRATLETIDIKNINESVLKLFIQSVSSKSKKWSYEEEWRIIQLPEFIDEKWEQDKKGVLLDMIPPSSIILGCRAKPEFESQVKEYCENSKINLYKMEKDEYEYKLNRKPILEF